ncbi:HlyD family secretion protein [Hyphomonas sp. ND6WE1B]|uniref:HlyD family secretion protein n=1 Tax=Hyphomonas sp. ND6WE1B TaxID=1848191 RepID=UPI0008076A67|nr:HlyD family secretion protein [Hyphomonas sp. ND6WE1B]
MLSRFSRHIATLLAAAVGLAGLVAVLFAWRLPPFQSSLEITEDAYIQGEVTEISPQVAGQVDRVSVGDFQTVSQGDVLIHIDDRIFRQNLVRAEAELSMRQAAVATLEQDIAAARAQVRAAEARVQAVSSELSLAESSLEKYERLQKSHAISDLEAERSLRTRDQAKAAYQEALADLDAARQGLTSISSQRRTLEARIEEADAAIKLAEIDLGNTEIRAPVDGQMGQVSARLGQYVTPGMSLTSLVPESRWVIANFKETQLEGLQAGQPVSFRVDALGGREFKGWISRFSPATGSQFSVIRASNATGNFIKIAQRVPVRVEIQPGQAGLQQLVPGMSVVVHVDTSDEPLSAQSEAAGEPRRPGSAEEMDISDVQYPSASLRTEL